jgi:hypothetical protein
MPDDVGSPHPTPSRRRFLRQAAGRQRTVTLSCARLFVRYVDAVAAGHLDRFERSVRSEVGEADEVRLTDTEWLAREDFCQNLDDILRQRAQVPSRRSTDRSPL